ncbi:cardiolipin synthase (CMP-forming) [Hyperolius riggenbachi]|uniref:cardiolipin synthase (CMP-forming) n=1 Tax=Hyperolius riggenbachi TaxID=752182 RepID=UPI0035A2AC94
MSVLALLLGRTPLAVLSCPGRRLLSGRDVLHEAWARARHAVCVLPGPGRARPAPSTPLSARLQRPLLRLPARILCGTAARLAEQTQGDPSRSPVQEQPANGNELYENPWTIPNFLSMTRIGLSPVLGYLIVDHNFNIALGIFALAGLTDLLDGYIARNWANQKSALGSALDPLADKILISVLYVCLTYADLIPVPLTGLIILRDIVLIAAVFYVRYKTLPPPRTVGRYFNPCYATARLEPTFISKLNTAVQLILVAASLAAPVFNYVDSVYLQVLWCITSVTTVASGYSYYHYGQKTVKVLKNKD